MKERIDATIEKGLKQKAKEKGLNISEAVEEVLREKTKDVDKTTLILSVEKYGISLIPNNWVVGRLEDVPVASIEATQGKKRGFFKNGTETYHLTLHQALIAVSKRLLEDKLKVVCKEKPLELRELAKLVKEHHEWFVDIVKGF